MIPDPWSKFVDERSTCFEKEKKRCYMKCSIQKISIHIIYVYIYNITIYVGRNMSKVHYVHRYFLVFYLGEGGEIACLAAALGPLSCLDAALGPQA